MVGAHMVMGVVRMSERDRDENFRGHDFNECMLLLYLTRLRTSQSSSLDWSSIPGYNERLHRETDALVLLYYF